MKVWIRLGILTIALMVDDMNKPKMDMINAESNNPQAMAQNNRADFWLYHREK